MCFKTSPGAAYREFKCTDINFYTSRPGFYLSIHIYGIYFTGLPEPGAILVWLCDLGDVAFPLLPPLSPFPARSSLQVLAPRPLHQQSSQSMGRTQKGQTL